MSLLRLRVILKHSDQNIKDSRTTAERPACEWTAIRSSSMVGDFDLKDGRTEEIIEEMDITALDERVVFDLCEALAGILR